MKRGPTQWGLILTQALNALTWGSAQVTFSARSGYAAYRGKRWALWVAVPVIDAVFGKDHCENQAIAEGLIDA